MSEVNFSFKRRRLTESNAFFMSRNIPQSEVFELKDVMGWLNKIMGTNQIKAPNFFWYILGYIALIF